MTKEDFLKDLNAWSNHRPLLYEALEVTRDLKLPVLELGSGEGSTPYLREYCKANDLVFLTFDSNRDWAKKMESVWSADWDKEDFWTVNFSVCLLDLAPGEYRRVALMKLVNTEIILLHDSEPPGWNASDYKVRPIFSKFKYVKDDVPKEKGAPWTSALSNTINVTKWSV